MVELVPDFILRKDAAQETRGSFSAAALFIDIPGFTRLTDALMQQGRAGAEALAGALRFYFDPLIAAVHDAGGFVASFAGDAFMALFPERDEAPRDPTAGAVARALDAALAMRRFVEAHPAFTAGPGLGASAPATPLGTFAFSFKIGLSWGAVAWGIVPVSPSRRYFYFQGAPLESCAAASHDARGGDILLDQGFVDACAAARFALPAVAPVSGLPRPPCPGDSHAGAPSTLGAFRLVAFGVPPLDPLPRAPPPNAVAARAFVDAAVAVAPPLGELRNVASVFLSFADIPSIAALIGLLHENASRYGGTFTGIDTGDKGTTALVHFGAPIAHENDAERALDFAIEVRASAPGAMRLRAGVTSDVRYAGFNGGTARCEFACLGRATNLAARLMNAAPWGEIWCDDQLEESARERYVWRPLRARRFKGFERPTKVYLLGGRRLPVVRQISELGLIGRDAELARLDALLSPIAAAGGARAPARAVYVEGEAGLGKSYLVERLRRKLVEARARRPLLWLDARCDQTLRGSLNALEYAARAYFFPASPLDREARLARFEEVLDDLGARLQPSQRALAQDLDRARAALAALVGVRRTGSSFEQLPPRRRFDETLAALGVLFRAECSTRPVVLHLEDAHWADDDSRAALRAVVSACSDLPLAVLITGRPRDDGSPIRIPFPLEIPVFAIELGPLADEHLIALAQPVFGGVVPQMIAGILRDNAGGNPLYAQEILAYWLAERGHTMSSITNTFSPPRSIASLLVARLDRLAPPVRATTLAASVLGREFDVRVLARMLRETWADASALERHLQIGQSQCLWAPVQAAAVADPRPLAGSGDVAAAGDPPAVRYRFENVLLCNAAYDVQSRAQLRELHGRAAEAILKVHGADDVDGQLTALARHFYRAGAFERAKLYFLAAARRAEARYAHDEARRLYQAYAKIEGGPLALSRGM